MATCDSDPFVALPLLTKVIASVVTVVLGAVCALLGTYSSIAKIAESY